jgi:hypothetical protein
MMCDMPNVNHIRVKRWMGSTGRDLSQLASEMSRLAIVRGWKPEDSEITVNGIRNALIGGVAQEPMSTGRISLIEELSGIPFDDLIAQDDPPPPPSEPSRRKMPDPPPEPKVEKTHPDKRGGRDRRNPTRGSDTAAAGERVAS